MVVNGLRKDVRVFAESGNNDAPADFEKAMSATGFGKYNIFLLLATIPAGWAGTFDTTTAAVYMSSAECDLHLSIIRNGFLVAFVYIGMIVSSFFWGFLTDTTSRKPLFMLGLLVDACCNILSSVVDSYYIFLLIKFITGTIVSGPIALLVPYLAEFQPSVHRDKFVTWAKFIFAIGNVIPAFLAYFILPLPWSFTVFNRVFVSWRCFCLICSIPSILGLVTVSFLPESPKRLIAIGEPDKALKLMKRMYSINTGKSADTFAIKSLISKEKLLDEKSSTNFDRIQESRTNLLTLLKPPHRSLFLITFFLQFGSMLGFNTIRLWLPHLFTLMNNFDYTQWNSAQGNPTMCQLLVRSRAASDLEDYTDIADDCVGLRIESFIYRNATIIAGSIVLSTSIIVVYLDTRHKKKVILVTSFLVGTMSCFSANWGGVVPSMLSLCSLVAATSSVASNIVTNLNDNVMLPPLKSTATSSLTMIGNFGTVFGSLIFPIILDTYCIAAFMWLGCCLLLCLVVSLFVLRSAPKPTKPEVAEEPETITRF